VKHLILVSHGKLADGLHNALGMLVGSGREDIRSVGLLDGMGADEYETHVRKIFEPVRPGDQVVLMGDLIGGSPLTTAVNVVSQLGLLADTVIIGGMNLPSALNAALNKDSVALDSLAETILDGAAVTQFIVESKESEEEI